MSQCTCGDAILPGERFCGSCGAPAPQPAAPGPPAVAHSPARPGLQPLQHASARAGPQPPGVPRASARATPDVLFVIHRSNRELCEALRAHGEVLPVTPSSALEAVRERTGSGSPKGAICLIGAPWELPMSVVEDPADKDEGVPTDNFFGSRSTPTAAERYTGTLLPDLPVGRIPFTRVDLVLDILARGEGLAPSWRGGLAVSAAVWRGTSDALLAEIAGEDRPRMLVAPHHTDSDVAGALQGRPGRCFFNVHGSDQEPVWVGEGGGVHPRVLHPGQVQIASGGIAVSEACYGAAMFEGEPAMGRAFLERGAGCFVGSTIIAWGQAHPPPSAADLVVLGFYRNLDSGLPAGLALLEAKRSILRRTLEQGEPLSPPIHNTLASFVLYGSPLARVAGAAPQAPAGDARPGGTLQAIRERSAGRAASGALGGVRSRMAERLHPGDWAALSYGRVAFAQLAGQVPGAGEIRRALEEALGQPPSDARVFRYRAGRAERTSVIASLRAPWGARHAAVIVAEDGTIRERYVSR